jgi:hypothetical protein
MKTKIELCLKLFPNDTKPGSRYMEVYAGICGSGKNRQISAVRSGSLQVDLYLPKLWAASRIKDYIWPAWPLRNTGKNHSVIISLLTTLRQSYRAMME